jgi:hypothetical protein
VTKTLRCCHIDGDGRACDTPPTHVLYGDDPVSDYLHACRGHVDELAGEGWTVGLLWDAREAPPDPDVLTVILLTGGPDIELTPTQREAIVLAAEFLHAGINPEHA